VSPQLQIPEEAVDSAMRQALAQVIDTVYNQMRSQISVKDIRETGMQLIESEDLRQEMSIHQAFLTMDLYQIQLTNWVDILKTTKDSLDEVLALRKVEIKALQEKNRLLREVELAEVALVKAKAEEDWDIALLRFRKIKGYLIVGVFLLVFGVLVGQVIEGMKRDSQVPVHPSKVHKPKPHK
jgi:hypothetical protein